MKIQLKHSNVLEAGQAKEPTASQMEDGELAVNYNAADPTLFIRDSAGQIVGLHINDIGTVSSGPNPPNSGNQVGDLFYDTNLNALLYWNGSGWEQITTETNGGYIKILDDGVQQSITGGGGIDIAGPTVVDDLSASGALTVDQNASVGGDFTVTGSAAIGVDLSVSGNTSVTGELNAASDATVAGDLNVTGTVTAGVFNLDALQELP